MGRRRAWLLRRPADEAVNPCVRTQRFAGEACRWIVEKWRSWADSGGDIEHAVSRNALLTMLTIYWVAGTITISMRDYYDNRWDGVALGSDAFVGVPSGIASFAHQLVFEGQPPRG